MASAAPGPGRAWMVTLAGLAISMRLIAARVKVLADAESGRPEARASRRSGRLRYAVTFCGDVVQITNAVPDAP